MIKFLCDNIVSHVMWWVDGKRLGPIQGGPKIITCSHHVDQFDHVDYSQL
jgi:hypothetical protein